jgi:hypothetical protein
MSNNTGTGFWVVLALMVILSIVAIFEAAVRFISHKIGFRHMASPRHQRRAAALHHR